MADSPSTLDGFTMGSGRLVNRPPFYHRFPLIRLMHANRWMWALTAIVSLMTVPTLAVDSSTQNTHRLQQEQLQDFLRYCQNGPLPQLQAIHEDHPDWIRTARTATGETCLHLACLAGHTAGLDWLLGLPDGPTLMELRTLGDRALRETPLVMSVKNGHGAAARRLLEAGADVNVEFDSESAARARAHVTGESSAGHSHDCFSVDGALTH